MIIRPETSSGLCQVSASVKLGKGATPHVLNKETRLAQKTGAAQATVEVGMTVAPKPFHFVKTSATVSLPCEPGKIKETLAECTSIAEEAMDVNLEELQKQMKEALAAGKDGKDGVDYSA